MVTAKVRVTAKLRNVSEVRHLARSVLMVNRLIATGLLAIASLWLVACGTGGVGST